MKTLDNLTVFHGILNDPLVSAFARYCDEGENSLAQTEFLRVLFQENAQDLFAAYLCDAVLKNENAFSRACASGAQLSPYLRAAAISDLKAIGTALKNCPNGGFSKGESDKLFGNWDEKTAERLELYYRENGYGRFLSHIAFRYAQNELVPIYYPSHITMQNLKKYEREKAEVLDNFENFALGLPYADMLLYGDRGTGKSSTVHAAVNCFAEKKIRLVELAKEDLLFLPRLKTQLAEIPMKFIVFVDDFSLEGDDDRISTLKAALQGSMEGHAENVMIVATSNRRHIVEETFDRRNSVHAGDSEQELLSLSDRFGITVYFSSVDKTEYLAIVQELATDSNLQTDRETLARYAERWALLKGGRSPRRAKQFIDFVSACESKGKPIEL